MNAEELELYKKLQPVIAEKMGPLQEGDRYTSNGLWPHFFTYEGGIMSGDEIRIPLPIDPVNPERGLWGMISGPATFGRTECGNYDFFCVSKDGRVVEVTADTPTLALLKALEAQAGK